MKLPNKNHLSPKENFIYLSPLNQIMALDKKPLKEILGKLVVTKEGKRLGRPHGAKDKKKRRKSGHFYQIE